MVFKNENMETKEKDQDAEHVDPDVLLRQINHMIGVVNNHLKEQKIPMRAGVRRNMKVSSVFSEENPTWEIVIHQFKRSNNLTVWIRTEEDICKFYEDILQNKFL